jgi:hypothetical protein
MVKEDCSKNIHAKLGFWFYITPVVLAERFEMQNIY